MLCSLYSVPVVCVFSRNYDLEDIERIIDKYIDDSRPADQLYDEMTAALQTLSQVSIVYRVFHKKHPLHIFIISHSNVDQF